MYQCMRIFFYVTCAKYYLKEWTICTDLIRIHEWTENRELRTISRPKSTCLLVLQLCTLSSLVSVLGQERIGSLMPRRDIDDIDMEGGDHGAIAVWVEVW